MLQIAFFPMFILTQLAGVYSPFTNLGWAVYDAFLWSLTAYFTVYPLMNVDSVYQNIKYNTSEPYNTKVAMKKAEKRKPRSD